MGGAGLSVSLQGGLVVRSLRRLWQLTSLQDHDTENLAMTWSSRTGVTGGHFRWTARTPPNGSTTLDLQLIKLTPFVVCATGLTPAPVAARGQAPFRRGGIGD